MKVRILALFLSQFLFTQYVFAQQFTRPEKCGTTEHLNYQKSKNPSLSQQLIDDENLLQQTINRLALTRSTNAIYTIPVVVHVIYRTNAENISDAQILSQIDVLNEDFGRRNADTVNTPVAFRSVASATNFQFCLAKRDVNRNPTSGIERRQTSLHSFQINDEMKFYSSGGLDAWDVNKYLNIWVCNLGNQILGYGEMPASVHTDTYGLVVQYDCFGRTGTVTPPYNLGRTCTHEISHCFRLYHIWGDDFGACGSPGDYCSDTPDQTEETYGCFSYPHIDNCSPVNPGIMFMNYMDYSDDNCLNLFTANQSSRMFGAINAYYNSLLSSDGCEDVSGIESPNPNDFQVSIYPNPTEGILYLDMYATKFIGQEIKVLVTDYLGKEILRSTIASPNGRVHQLDLRGKSNGIYFVTMYNDDYLKSARFTLAN